MPTYKIVNETPTVADFWFRQPLVNEDGSFKTTEDGSIQVEQMVVRSITDDRITSLSNAVAVEHAGLEDKINEQKATIATLEARIAELESYKPDTAKNTVKSLTGANVYTLAPKDYGIYNLTLTSASSYIMIDNSGLRSDYLTELRIYMKQGTGSNQVVWDDKIQWINGLTPTLSENINNTDIILLSTLDAGKTWKGVAMTDMQYIVIA